MDIFGIKLANGELIFRKSTTTSAAFTSHFRSNVDTPERKTALAAQAKYRKATRQGGQQTLNVWIVDEIVNESGPSNVIAVSTHIVYELMV